MIQVYNVYIDEKQVVGVGPLLVKRSSDPVAMMAYKERTFYFELYLTHYRVVVSTDTLSFNESYIEKSREVQAAITEAHKSIRDCLLNGTFAALYAAPDPQSRGYSG